VGAPRRRPLVELSRAYEDLGYRVGGFDGRLGKRTRTAIRNFQRNKRLNATGELDDEILAALDEDSGSATSGAGAR
jgi:peptidoglycan hydrolase-like protein with peptidoglycan-binding domain